MDINISFHFPFSPMNLILGITVLVNLALAYRSWISSRRNPVNIYFALTILMAAFWTASNLGFRVLNQPLLISLFLRLSTVFATLISFFFYLFTYHFPFRTFKLKTTSLLLLVSGTLFISAIVGLPNFLLAEQISPEERFNIMINWSKFWHAVFGIYFSSIMILSFRNLWLKYKQADGLWRLRLKQVMIAVGVAVIGGSVCNLFIPFFFNRFVAGAALGPIFTVVMAVYIWYYIFWIPSRLPKH